ncbi:MAG TPA: prepilin-type N-terminal cleavage/methylation domain-containing protein [Vicinamibacterales bacterium]|jgi:Tfp pilus assembly protein PilW
MTVAQLKDQRGFTLVELLVASVCTVVVLGGAVALTSQIQSGYRRQLEDSVGEQEARYALEWIGRYLRSVGNNPFNRPSSDCPTAGTQFVGLLPNTTTGSLTLQSDSNPPDGLIGGSSGDCTQTNEHVTISHNATLHEIEFLDQAVGTTATTRTDSVIEGLQFVYLDSNHDPWVPSANPPPVGEFANIFYVQTNITIRTRTINVAAGAPATRTISSEIRVRNR